MRRDGLLIVWLINDEVIELVIRVDMLDVSGIFGLAKVRNLLFVFE